MGFFTKGLKNEFETTVVNEPSVFEPLKFYCICIVDRVLFHVSVAHYRSPSRTNSEVSIEKMVITYSRLSLSPPRLSQITAYLEVKIWSLF